MIGVFTYKNLINWKIVEVIISAGSLLADVTKLYLRVMNTYITPQPKSFPLLLAVSYSILFNCKSQTK